jgi:hypothetical protein
MMLHQVFLAPGGILQIGIAAPRLLRHFATALVEFDRVAQPFIGIDSYAAFLAAFAALAFFRFSTSFALAAAESFRFGAVLITAAVFFGSGPVVVEGC